jgi:hypothetical protein
MRWWAYLVVAAAAAAGVAAFALPRGQAMKMGSRIDGLIQRLRSPDVSTVESAAEELRRIAKSGVTEDEAICLLRGAAGSFPKRKFDFQSTPADLVRAAAENPTNGLTSVVAEVFSALAQPAKTEALVLLMKSSDRRAAETVIELLHAQRNAKATIEIRTTPLQREPKHADVYFPALLDFAAGPSEFEICAALLAACEAGALTPAQLALHTGKVLAIWNRLREAVRSAQTGAKPGWFWEDDYQELRGRAGLVLDIFGYLPSGEVRTELQAALQFADPKLKLLAAVSLLRAGERVPEGVIEEVAASAECRNWLHSSLAKMGKGASYPAKWNTQQAFAESEMVGWLVFPTELGRPPDDIELMRVVSQSFREGVFDWYLFRFRTREPHWAAEKGWMAGVAGPFRRADAPSPTSYGDTFSSFDKWDSMSPDDHVRSVRELIEEWQQRHSSR